MKCFFFNDTATTEIYTLSLHDALPISPGARVRARPGLEGPHRDEPPADLRLQKQEHPGSTRRSTQDRGLFKRGRSEEHTSELQSRQYLVCRLLLEKKNPNLLLLLFSST